MALQNLQITAVTAMRARDVSRPGQEHQDAADRRPLRDETPRRDSRRGRDTRLDQPSDESARQGSGGSSPVNS
ncbi:hypothetical protein JOL79_31480 [Microbispora sp. RL4-1S]|uniref:Uncharacterized protein n=1 Tax=Microbispora oryzae TaxID=2806554 RepID=A0A940WWN2_9ACTN|nr:hypothetical protein [Microbispora oryzae]MBP2708309.1 hypothetical protein [Microbispora oryzae]